MLQFTVIFENNVQVDANTMEQARQLRDEYEAAGHMPVAIRQNWV